jgi:hypothetical protein
MREPAWTRRAGLRGEFRETRRSDQFRTLRAVSRIRSCGKPLPFRVQAEGFDNEANCAGAIEKVRYALTPHKAE